MFSADRQPKRLARVLSSLPSPATVAAVAMYVSALAGGGQADTLIGPQTVSANDGATALAAPPTTTRRPRAGAGTTAPSADAMTSFQPRPLTAIAPGTHVGHEPPDDWSHLISFVRARLSTGDVDSVPKTVGYYAKIFNLVMLADAKKVESGKYVLDRVGVGFSMEIDDQNTIVTSATQDQFGGDLSLVGRSVLDGNMDAIKEVRQLARTRHSMLIDAPAVMLREGEHREMNVRYFVWVFPANGNIGTVVWLVDPSAENPATRLPEAAIQLLPPNMQEDRQMNVKADKFNLLGIPAKDAFALVQIPQGKAYEMSESFHRFAGLERYDAASFAKLTSAVAETLRGSK